MRSVNGERASQWTFALQVAGAVVALLIASRGNSSGSTDSIALDRDVEIAGISGNAMSVAAMPGGGFVIAGYWQAVATDANGTVQWRYPDPGADTTPKKNNPSEFHGVVPLSNGNILLCGIKWTSAGSTGLLTILNRAGQLVDKRFMQPSGPDKYFATKFDRCFRWGDGVAVIGGTAVGVTGLGWLMKLDSDGVKQWDLFDVGLLGIDAIETVDHSLVMANTDLATSSTRLVQVNPQGQIVSMKDFTGYPDNMVRSAAPTSTLKILTNMNRKNTEVFTLNERFEQIAPAQPTKIPVATDGCAWVLWDGSVAVFGHVFAQPGTDRSSVARIAMGERSDEMRAFALPTPQSTSYRVYDAVPISEKTFVAVRGFNASVALSWVTFK